MRRWQGLRLRVLLRVASSARWRFGEELGTRAEVDATSRRWVEIGCLVAFLGLVRIENPMVFFIISHFLIRVT